MPIAKFLNHEFQELIRIDDSVDLIPLRRLFFLSPPIYCGNLEIILNILYLLKPSQG